MIGEDMEFERIDGPKLKSLQKQQKFWSPSIDVWRTSETKTTDIKNENGKDSSVENDLFQKRKVEEPNKDTQKTSSSSKIQINFQSKPTRQLETLAKPIVDPKFYKKNSYEIFKMLKMAIRKIDFVFIRNCFAKIQLSSISDDFSRYLLLANAIDRTVLKYILKKRKSNSSFKSKIAELNDLKILAYRTQNLSPNHQIISTIQLLQDDLKSFIFTGKFCYDQKIIDEKMQNCLESDANSETPQVLISDSVSSMQDNLKHLKHKIINHGSFKDYNNTVNQSSQMTNGEQSVSHKNMFKKFKKNNLSESRCHFKPKIESAKINFINIKSKIDCWNFPIKKNRFTTETESQTSQAEFNDLSKLREKFKNQYSKPFLKSIKKIDNLDIETSVSKSRNDSINVYQNKLVPKISFNDYSAQSKRIVARMKDSNYRTNYDLSRPIRLTPNKSMIKPTLGDSKNQTEESKQIIADKLTFEEIRETYINKYLAELGKLVENEKNVSRTKINNFDPSFVKINDQSLSLFELTGRNFHEILNLVNRRFEKIVSG